jgi:NAD(P)-dependent dehydrogenase (short-subunit alcohol dehydrogenase family)
MPYLIVRDLSGQDMKLTDASGKVWLITCDCRGLVQALAEAVLASGHNVVATAVEREPLKYLGECYGDQLRIVPRDVTDPLAAESAIQAALGAFGRVDVLVLDLTKWRGAESPAHSLADHLNRGQVLPADSRPARAAERG